MIKKLRWRFILINMTLVSIVLAVVFISIGLSTYQRERMKSIDNMMRTLNNEHKDGPPKFQIGGDTPEKPIDMLPVFAVVLDDNQNILETRGEHVDISDELLSEAVALVLSSHESEGILSGLNLRYLRQEQGDKIRIAFIDISEERQVMTELVVTLVLVGMGSLAAFFLISLFLSGLALAPVEKAWKQQRQFVADASHELKTPITVILANTRILLSHKQDTIDKQQKWISYIETEAGRMKGLVDDMLFLAKSDDHETSVSLFPINLSDTVWSALLPFESVAFEQGIILESDIAPDITVKGDTGQLKQLVGTLLDNACKYAGEKGTVTVVLDRWGDKARLQVKNTGPLIPPEHLEHLFERFYRADKSRGRESGGYGLGLAIAGRITEGHGGKIKAESTAETGTVFTVVLPMKEQP